jgi:hypothetical protein
MDRKLLAICFLTISAMGLMIADFVSPTARAAAVVVDRDYQVVTARIASGDDAVYILDNRTAKLVVLSYDPTSRSLLPRAMQPVSDAFK